MNRSRELPLGPYKLLTSVHYKQLSWEPGDVVTFPQGVNIEWLVERGAVKLMRVKEEVMKEDG